MDNAAIADNFSLLGKLIDIHGDDSFKAKSYAAASFAIDKLPVQLSSLPAEKIFGIKGIGQAIGKKIQEQLETGHLPALEQYILKTPPGVLEFLHIKGLGPKKIATVWKELGIETVGELLYACEENRLMLYKGFGEKTQQNIQESINFYLASQGNFLYGKIEMYAQSFTEKLQAIFPGKVFEITGGFKRQMETIDKLEWVTDAAAADLSDFFTKNEYQVRIENEILFAKGQENVDLEFHCVGKSQIAACLFQKNASPEFLDTWNEKYGKHLPETINTVEQIFDHYNLAFIPSFYREKANAIKEAEENLLPKFITVKDIKGIIHTHSNWSDGSDTIEAMARHAIAQGFEYLVMSDHSQSAFYANGLYPDRVKAQHLLIDELNEQLKPFKIFKSIESDILNDGKLDYTDEVLQSFDLVIASVHSNLKMSEEKAMMRLMNAIENPYTTILGHMTGRLLLSRNGYPVNHDEIIKACARHKVTIELNAHSRRLDIDWRHINAVVEQGVLISIDPDSHAASAFTDIRYGVLAAQKAGLTAQHNLSSFSLSEFETFLQNRKG